MICPLCNTPIVLNGNYTFNLGEWKKFQCNRLCSFWTYFDNKCSEWRISQIVNGNIYELLSLRHSNRTFLKYDYSSIFFPYFMQPPNTQEYLNKIIPKLLKLKAFS